MKAWMENGNLYLPNICEMYLRPLRRPFTFVDINMEERRDVETFHLRVAYAYDYG